MPLVLADRVRDTTTTTGTGTVTLSGTAPSGYQNFSVVGNGNTTYYTINAGSQWEVGIGTYSSTGPTLARTTVLASSNSGSLVDFSAGTKDVFVTYPAGESVYQDGASIAAGTAVLGVANGGTGAATLTTNGVLYGNGTSALAVTAAGTTGQVLVGNTGGAPSWATLTGIGVTSFSAGTTGLTPSTGTTGAITLAGTLGVANGGTGATTLSSGYLVKGNGTSAVSASVIYDNGTNVGIGTSAPGVKLDVIGLVRGTSFTANSSSSYEPQFSASNTAADATGGYFIFYKGRTGPATSQNGDTLGTVLWYGYDTTNTAVATGSILSIQTGAAGAGTVPSALVFANGANAERMRIDTNGNVGIGTSAPLGPLQVVGAAYFGSSSAQTTGTAAIYNDGNNVTIEAFAGNNTATKRNLLLATYGGNVGIGTTTPGFKLQVNGPIGIPSDVNGKLDIGRFSSGYGGGAIDFTGGTFGVIQINSSEKVRVTDAGNVGIGTSSPGTKLSVNGAVTAGTESGVSYYIDTNAAIRNTSTSGNTMYFDSGVGSGSTGGDFQFRATASYTTRLYINGNTGNVGIGTSSPSSRLTVQGDELIIPAAGWTSGQAARLYLGDTNNGVQSVNGSYQTYFAFNGHSWNVNASEAMRIDGSRNVGIGTSTPGYRLDVSGVINTNAAVRMTPTNVGAFTRAQLQSAYSLDGTGASVFTWNYTNGGGELDLFINRNGGGTGGLKIYDFPNTSGNPTNIFTVEGGGNVGIGTASPATSLSVVTNTTSHIGMRVTNNSTTQFAGSGLQMLGPSAAGTQGGAAIYYYNTTVGGTQGGMAMAQLDSNGSFQRNVAYYDFNGQSWSFLTNSAERLFITSAGNVGIGTSGPGATLDVAGTIRTSAGGSDPGTGTVLYYVGSGSFQTVIAGAAFAVHTGNNFARTERMRIDINGLVGIGTSSPGAKLDVTTASGANIVVSRSSAAGYAAFQRIAPAGQQVYDFYTINGTEAGRITVDGSNFMAFSTGSSATERMRIDGSGNVGIGTSSPAGRLDVVSTSAGGASFMRVANGSGAANSYAAISLDPGNNGFNTRDAQIRAINNGSNQISLTFLTSNAGTPFEAMRIDNVGNVGIGTASPDVRLSVQDAGAGQITLKDSGGTTRAYVMTNGAIGTAPTNALRLRGDAGIALGAVGSLAMFIDTSNNVGIGTTSPGDRLDVAGGNIRIANNYNLLFRNTAGTATARFLVQNDDNFVVYNASGTPISSFTQGSTNIAVYGSNGSNRMTVDSVNNVTSWNVNGSERMRIDGFGSVLIGTTSGGRSLCLFGSDVWQRIQNASRSWLLGMGTGSSFIIYDETSGLNRFVVDTSGNWNGQNSIALGAGVNLDNKIEIGAGRTGNNYAYIDLIGDTTYTDYGLRLIRGNGGPNATSQLVHRGTGDMYITTQDAATLYIQTNNATRAYFQTDGTMVMNGALLVGRNTTGSNVNTNNDTGSFSVRGDGSNAASISFHRTGAFAMNMGLGTDAIFRMGGWSMSSNCFQMDGSGNLTMLGNVTAYSDARIKKDVETIGSALDLVSKMRGVRYTRIDSGKRGVGVIAQEMLEVLPEVVQQGVGDDDTLSVAYGNLVGVLIEAIKELRAEVAELKGK
jgi:hypothetical protein